MALKEEELSIITIREFFEIENLQIPDYQRPYRWGHKSANVLLNDIVEANNSGIKNYRLGSVILHENKENGVYNIVDGQQRLTTLSILLYCIGNRLKEIKSKRESKEDNKENEKLNLPLLKQNYNDLSHRAININYNLYKKRLSEFDDESKLDKIKDYILDNCEIVKIVTDDEQEAFQFFDSQNNRGKALKPHDLLKSYHLREMNNMKTREKTDLISGWEDIDQNELAELFKIYLYPVIRWYKKKSGLNFSDKEIDIFKGIKQDNIFNYAQYHKASNIFTEQFNLSRNNELLGIEELNQYQLTQPIISGKRFFYYVLHYKKLLQQVEDRMSTFGDSLFTSNGIGNRYIKELYECILLFFADRFSLNSLEDNVMKQIYVYCYSLRFSMEKIQQNTVNNYACGIIPNRASFEDTEAGIAIFEAISEMKQPNELSLLLFPKLDYAKINSKYKNEDNEYYINSLNKVCEWNGIEQSKTEEKRQDK